MSLWDVYMTGTERPVNLHTSSKQTPPKKKNRSEPVNLHTFSLYNHARIETWHSETCTWLKLNDLWTYIPHLKMQIRNLEVSTSTQPLKEKFFGHSTIIDQGIVVEACKFSQRQGAQNETIVAHRPRPSKHVVSAVCTRLFDEQVQLHLFDCRPHWTSMNINEPPWTWMRIPGIVSVTTMKISHINSWAIPSWNTGVTSQVVHY